MIEQISNFISLYFWPVILSGVLLALGILLEYVIITRIKSWVRSKNWEGGEHLIKAFKGITFILFLGLSIYVFVNNIDLSEKLSNYLNESLFIASVLSITLLSARVVVAYVNSKTDTINGDFPATSIFANLIRVIIFSIGFLFILQSVGISVTPIITALGVGGIAVALALQDTLSNLFAGISLIVSKSINIGDYVRLQSNEEGYVQDISWRTTTIKDNAENILVVPNNKLSTAIFRNFSLPEKEINLTISLLLNPEADIVLAETLLLKSANQLIANQPGCVKSFSPLVRFMAINEFGIPTNVIVKIREYSEQGVARHEFIKMAFSEFKKNGIPMPKPRG